MPALLPDEHELVTARQSLWIVLKPPSRWGWLAWAVVTLAAFLLATVLGWVVLVAVPVLTLGWRWYNWEAERIILTTKRIIRIAGVPETTEIEAYLRVERISGVVLKQSVWGRLFGNFGTIYLEAPGDHPTLRKLEMVADVTKFYRRLRSANFTQSVPPADPDDGYGPTGSNDGRDGEYITEELPLVPPDRHRFGRRHTD